MKPKGHICGRGYKLCSNGNGDGGPVAGAGDEARPVIHVHVAIDTKRPGSWMCARQLAQSHCRNPTDKCGKCETQNDGRPGEVHGGCRAEQQASPNRASDGNHGHLPGMQLVVQALFSRDFILLRHARRISESAAFAKKCNPRPGASGTSELSHLIFAVYFGGARRSWSA